MLPQQGKPPVFNTGKEAFDAADALFTKIKEAPAGYKGAAFDNWYGAEICAALRKFGYGLRATEIEGASVE